MEDIFKKEGAQDEEKAKSQANEKEDISLELNLCASERNTFLTPNQDGFVLNSRKHLAFRLIGDSTNGGYAELFDYTTYTPIHRYIVKDPLLFEAVEQSIESLKEDEGEDDAPTFPLKDLLDCFSDELSYKPETDAEKAIARIFPQALFANPRDTEFFSFKAVEKNSLELTNVLDGYFWRKTTITPLQDGFEISFKSITDKKNPPSEIKFFIQSSAEIALKTAKKFLFLDSKDVLGKALTDLQNRDKYPLIIRSLANIDLNGVHLHAVKDLTITKSTITDCRIFISEPCIIKNSTLENVICTGLGGEVAILDSKVSNLELDYLFSTTVLSVRTSGEYGVDAIKTAPYFRSPLILLPFGALGDNVKAYTVEDLRSDRIYKEARKLKIPPAVKQLGSADSFVDLHKTEVYGEPTPLTMTGGKWVDILGGAKNFVSFFSKEVSARRGDLYIKEAEPQSDLRTDHKNFLGLFNQKHEKEGKFYKIQGSIFFIGDDDSIGTVVDKSGLFGLVVQKVVQPVGKEVLEKAVAKLCKEAHFEPAIIFGK